MLVPLRVRAPDDSPFQAYVDHAEVGSVVVARLRSTPHVVTRDARSITSTDRDLFKLVADRRGALTVAQNGRRGSVIAAFLSGLADNVDDLPGSGGIRLADALSSLIVAAFTETTPERVDTSSDLADRILAYALAHLRDPLLSAESVARRHGISVRHLHTLLQRRDVTFAAWVRAERLRRVRRDLLDPAFAQRTTAAIAAHWGLHDPGHLARALKREFGQTAAEIRRTAPAGP